MMDTFAQIFAAVPVNQASALAERRGDWSDQEPIDMASRHPFAYCVSDTKWLKYFLTDWYNFYYGSVLNQDLLPYEMIVKALSLASAPINGRKLVSMWACVDNTADWYAVGHPHNDGKLLKDHKPAEIEESYLLILAKTVPENELAKKLHISSEDEHSSFRKWYLARLKDVHEKQLTGTLQICNVAAFMAAVALRSLAKDSDQLLASYLKSNFQDNCKKVAFVHYSLQIPAPHKGFISRIESCLSRGATNSKILLAHFLTLLLAEQLPQFDGTSIDIVKTFIKSSALTHLEHNGLSVCALFCQVLHAFGTNPQDLALNLKSGAIKTSLMAVGSALGKYQNCRTWWWSRVYDDGYLPEMRSDRHSMLIAILSEMLIQKSPDVHVGIMESRAVKKMTSQDQWAAKLYASSVIDVCYSFESEVANSAVAARYQKNNR